MKIDLTMSKPVVINQTIIDVFKEQGIEDCTAEVHEGQVILNFRYEGSTYVFNVIHTNGLFIMNLFIDGNEEISLNRVNKDVFVENLVQEPFSRWFIIENI